MKAAVLPPTTAGKRQRVLVASVSAGTGHVRAAEAIVEAMRIAMPRVQVAHVNVLEHARPGFRRFYEDGYSFLVNRAPATWAKLYQWSDRAHGVADRVLNHLQRLQTRAFLDLVLEFAPHRLLATHFLIAPLLETFPPQARPRLDVVITDFDVHWLWIHPLVDRYFVASELAASRLREAGVEPTRIVLSGIPIHPVFLRVVDRDAVRDKLALRGEGPVALLLAGGQGFGALHQAVAGLFATTSPLQIVSVAGRNEALRATITALSPPENISLKSLGFVNNMHEWMAAADVVVTKPGGLTVSEGLARGAALVLHSAIPGQEERNANFVVGRGAGVRVDDLRDLPSAVFDCLADPARLAALRDNAVGLGKPRAAFTVAQAAVAAINAA